MLFSPPEIKVYHPPTDAIPTYTTLFRKTAKLPRVAKLLMELTPPETTPTIVSAACSVGAEVYGLLALLNVMQGNRPVSITGLDINDEALAEAQTGQLKILPDIYLFQSSQLRRVARRFGFDLQQSETSPTQKQFDTTAVTKAHTVRFVNADIREGLDGVSGAHLVMANNILYHLYRSGAGEAEIAARNLAAAVGETGILSMSQGFGSRAHPQTLFGQWRLELDQMLQADYDLVPIVNDQSRLPITWAREG